MKMLSFKDFLVDFGKITKHRMNMSMYDEISSARVEENTGFNIMGFR